MRSLYLITLVMMLTACNSVEQNTATATMEDFTGYEITKIPGSISRMAVKKDGNGNILEKGYIREGARDGVWISYHNDANKFPKVITSYIGGLKNGAEYKLNNRGQIEEEINYLNNELHGKYAKYRFGRPKTIIHYKNGKYHGTYTEFSNTGNPQKIMNFKEGKQDGKLQYLDESGNVTLEYTYKDGKKVGGGMVEKK